MQPKNVTLHIIKVFPSFTVGTTIVYNGTFNNEIHSFG